MKRFLWTCALGALPLVSACDTQLPPAEAQLVATQDSDAPALPTAGLETDADPIPAHECGGGDCDCDCDQGCGEGGAHDGSEEARRSAPKALDATAIAAVQRTDRPAQGPDDARVEIMVFSDFECPYCRKAVPVLEEVLASYPEDVRVTFKQLPLPFHEAADPAARASLAAHRQGKFWSMHDALFEQPSRVRSGEFEKLAAEAGLDVGQFERDMNDPKLAAQVARDAQDARALGIRGTPTLVIGNKLVVGAQPLEVVREIIDAELAAS